MTYKQCPNCGKSFSTVGIRMHIQKCTGEPVTFLNGDSAKTKPEKRRKEK